MRRRSSSKMNDAKMASPRRRASLSGGEYRIGYTIAGESRQKKEAERERARLRRSKKRKNRIIFGLSLIVVITIVAMVAVASTQYAEQREAERIAAEQKAITPTVPIIDQNKSESVSGRVKEFVVQLEKQVADTDLEIERVVLPYQKAREIHIYLKGRGEFYKMTIDRGSAEQMENLARMVQYLDERQIDCEYVDLRVKGRAYYK